MDTTDRVEIQIALGSDCKPLDDRLALCRRSGGDCTRELRMLNQCRVMAKEPVGPLKPSKRINVSEKLSSYSEAADCSAPLSAVKKCLSKRHDPRFCASQIEDFKTCKMILENKNNLKVER